MPTPTPDTWLDLPDDHPFGITHLPYGVFSTADSGPRVGVRIGDQVLDGVVGHAVGAGADREAALVHGDGPVAGGAQGVQRRGPGVGELRPAVQQQDGFAVGRTRGERVVPVRSDGDGQFLQVGHDSPPVRAAT